MNSFWLSDGSPTEGSWYAREVAIRVSVLWVYGSAIALRRPARARAAFEQALREEPNNAQALYGCGMLLERQGPEHAGGRGGRGGPDASESGWQVHGLDGPLPCEDNGAL